MRALTETKHSQTITKRSAKEKYRKINDKDEFKLTCNKNKALIIRNGRIKLIC